MHTKKSLLLLICIAVTQFAQSQKKYYTFSIDDSIGITDQLGNEIIPPSFKYSDDVPKKNEIHLKNYSDKPDVIFNTITGKTTEYQHIYSTPLKINGELFVELKQKNTRHLMSLERDFQIKLTRRFSDFTNNGNYIFEKYSETVYAKEKPTPPAKKTTSGVPPPPPPPQILPPPTEVNYYGIINNDEKFTTVKRIAADFYLQLYKEPEVEKDEDGNVVHRLKIITLDANAINPFDFIIFSKNKTHQIYDAKMKWIKTFTLAKAEKEDLIAYAKKALNTNLSEYSKNSMPPAPMMVSSSNYGQQDKPEIIYPYFYLKTSNDSETIFGLQESKDSDQIIFKLDSQVASKLDLKKHRIGLKYLEDKWIFFSFDPITGAPFLPKAYSDKVGMQIIIKL